MKLLIKYKNYFRLYISGITSEFGSFVTETAIMLFLFSASSQNKSLLGASRAVFILLFSIGSILGGPISEKLNRKKLLFFTEAIRIPIVASLLFFPNIYMAILVNGLVGFFTGIYSPARQKMINEIVPQEDISVANSLSASTLALIHLLGPLVGAYVFAVYHRLDEILIFDIITYLIGIYLIWVITYNAPKEEQETQTTLFGDLIEGLKFVKTRPDLIALFLNSFFAGLCIGTLIPLIRPFIGEQMALGDKEFGYFMALFGLGGLLGGGISTRIESSFHSGKQIILTIICEGFLMLWWIYNKIPFVSYSIFFIWGIIVFTRLTAQLNYVSNTIETKFLSRIHSLLGLSFVVPNVFGGLLVAFAGNNYSSFDILRYVSLFFIATTFMRLFMPQTKKLYRGDIGKVIRNLNSENLT